MYRVENTTERFKYERQAVEAFFGTAAVVSLGCNMWMCCKSGETCMTVKEERNAHSV